MAHQRVRHMPLMVSSFFFVLTLSLLIIMCSRYDLRPQNQRDANESTSRDGENSLPPPLALDEYETETAHNPHRHRLSRIFDVNRLRQASPEEQMAALRQMRAETNEAEPQAGETESRRQRRLAERLKERFRIRTQAQSGEQRDSRE